MGTQSFKRGTEVKIDGKWLTMQRLLDDGVWQLEDKTTGRFQEMTDGDLRRLYSDGKLSFRQHDRQQLPEGAMQVAADLLSGKEFEAAKMRRAYVLASRGAPNTEVALTAVSEETWKKLGVPAKPPSWVTLYRWRTRYEASGGDIKALLADRGKQGNTHHRFSKEVMGIVADAIKNVYMTPERKTVRDTLDSAMAQTLRENKLRLPGQQLELPTMRLLRRTIAATSAFDRCVARHGQTEANKRFRAVLAHRTTDAPLARAEIDHTPLDLMVTDDRTGLPLGRPWLTACIDDYTRCILGIHISFEPPSFHTVACCLRHSILPKQDLCERYPGISNEWEAHVVMRELVVDNGVEFHSASLEAACYTLGIEIHYSARKTPWFKGKIERFMRTINGAVAHGNPGTTFSNILEKEEYDPSKQAVIRYSMLLEIAHRWIADVYHQQQHRTLGVSPALMWQRNARSEDILLPDDPAAFDFILGRVESRRLTHKGIELYGLLYNSADLAAFRRTHGEALDVDVRVNTADLGTIFVLSPDKRSAFKVPALRVDYAQGLTEWQHKIFKRYAAAQGMEMSAEGWLEAKQCILDLVQGEFMHKKQRTRSKVARFQGTPPGGSVVEDVDAKPSVRPSAKRIPKVVDALGGAQSLVPESAPAAAPRVGNTPSQREGCQTVPTNSASVGKAVKRKFEPVHRERSVPPHEEDALLGEAP